MNGSLELIDEGMITQPDDSRVAGWTVSWMGTVKGLFIVKFYKNNSGFFFDRYCTKQPVPAWCENKKTVFVQKCVEWVQPGKCSKCIIVQTIKLTRIKTLSLT